MDHVAKPRCRYVHDEFGQVVGWLIHGLGVKVYSVKGIDHAISRWFDMAVRKILKVSTTA